MTCGKFRKEKEVKLLSDNEIKRISKSLAADYPAYQSVAPKVSGQSDGNYLLVYEKKEKTEDGLDLKRIVRVTVDSNGKILKISESR